MVTRILHNSERLCAFFDQLELTLYQSQRQHILNMADALLVCEEDKTLAALQRQFVEAPDASNMADCLRISPWQADDVRAVLRAHHVAWVVAPAERVGLPKMISMNLDDAIGEHQGDHRQFFRHHAEYQQSEPAGQPGVSRS